MLTFLGIFGSMSCVLLSETAHVSLLGVLRGCDIFAANELSTSSRPFVNLPTRNDMNVNSTSSLEVR
jgi:hypothetical protein